MRPDVQTSGRGCRISAAVALRECSVVIVGSTCRICGRDFKCESDVALHTRWRHNAALGSLIDILDRDKINHEDVGQRCDVCDMPFGILSDLRIHKRLIHSYKHRPRQRRRRRKGTVRVKFKLNGVTTTDVSLDRRYIELQNSLGYIVDVRTETPGPHENERPERKDDRAGNIDLSFPNRVADKSHMQHGTRPDNAANRYIVGKFASTEGDAIACHTVVVGNSLVAISNTSHKDAIPLSPRRVPQSFLLKKRGTLAPVELDIHLGYEEEEEEDAIPDSDSLCQGHEDRCCLASQETTADVFVKTFADSIDIRDKENSPRTNERERRNVHGRNEILFDDNKVLLACQPEKSDKTSPTSRENSRTGENPRYSIRWSDEGTKEAAGLANSFINSVEIIINDGKSYGFDGNATKHLSPALSRLNRITESKTNSKKTNVDDDVQEVLRIMRGNAQNDINHESPNRMEREMLVQNVGGDTLPPQQEPTIYPEDCDVVLTNFVSSDYPSFIAMTESEYQFLANSFNKKLGIYLEDLHHYGIRLCNDRPEINNNLEEYAHVYAHQNFFETWKQSDEPPYTSEMRANDNEVAVVLD